MSFIKNPFRKSDKVKAHQKPINPTLNRAVNQNAARTDAQGTKKSGLPRNYLDPNSMF